jgi:hypothetical protein
VSGDELYRSDPPQLAKVFAIDPTAPEVLTADELAAVLRHQLDTPLEVDLDDPAAPTASEHARRTTFGQLLLGPHPPLSLLERVRHFAKACKSRPDGPLPREIATALYFAAIVKAMLACGTRTSALGDEELRAGVGWTLSQPWIPREMCTLMQQGLARLGSG